MYTGELNRMTLTLPDEDYKILKKRLMVSKAVSEGWRYVIKEECICRLHDHGCDTCPLGGDCFIWVEPFNDGRLVRFGTSVIAWDVEDDKEARTVIKSMRKALLGMKHEEV